jgi:hypothetical protein
MSDLGIPIPRVKPNGVFCAGCGETGMHADTCPSRTSPMAPATAGDVAILRGMIEACIEHGQYVNKRLDALEADVERTKARMDRFDARLFDIGINVEARLLRLEAKRKK